MAINGRHRALLPPWQPGKTGNPSGVTKEQAKARSALRKAEPLVIAQLLEAAGINSEEETRIPIHLLPDPRAGLMALIDLANRLQGKPREMADTISAERRDPSSIRVNVSFSTARPQPLPLLEPPTMDVIPVGGESRVESLKRMIAETEANVRVLERQLLEKSSG